MDKGNNRGEIMSKMSELDVIVNTYVGNAYDVIFDDIAALYTMKMELMKADDRFLSDSTRQLIVENRVEELMAGPHGSMEDLLTNGFTGYSHMSDMELVLDVKETVSSWCGMDMGEGVLFPYNILGVEVKAEIERVLMAAIVDSVLK